MFVVFELYTKWEINHWICDKTNICTYTYEWIGGPKWRSKADIMQCILIHLVELNIEYSRFRIQLPKTDIFTKGIIS